MLKRPLLTLASAMILTGAFALGPVKAATFLSTAPIGVAAQTALGDLSFYRTITADTLTLIDKGDVAAAQKRGTDLETAWDKSEDTMKPADPTRWRVIDKAIDRVLSQLRAAKPETTGCAAALKDLLGTIDKGGSA